MSKATATITIPDGLNYPGYTPKESAQKWADMLITEAEELGIEFSKIYGKQYFETADGAFFTYQCWTNDPALYTDDWLSGIDFKTWWQLAPN